MRIPCVSCQTSFKLDSSLVKSTGSLVRCSKCKYIFMVYSPAFDEDPVTRDTNIDQSILFDLFKVEQKARVIDGVQENSKSMNRPAADEIASIDDSEEEDSDIEIASVESDNLPDLSEFEEMIDWDDIPDSEDFGDVPPILSGDGNRISISKVSTKS